MRQLEQLLFGAVVVVVLGACGGGKKGTTTPEPEPDGDGTAQEPTDGAMVTPDTMDEIQRMFQRKGNAVSRCLSVAVDNKELPKNSRGRITLGVTIATSGQVDEVKVIKATLESDSLTKCVVDKVKEIQFPAVPKLYPTTYTYAFEAS